MKIGKIDRVSIEFTNREGIKTELWMIPEENPRIADLQTSPDGSIVELRFQGSCDNMANSLWGFNSPEEEEEDEKGDPDIEETPIKKELGIVGKVVLSIFLGAITTPFILLLWSWVLGVISG